MTYQQTLHFLYNKIPQYSSIGIKAYKADLKNTITLASYLHDPQEKIKTIHVAGTNGKGSVSHMLAAVFQQNDYKTGLYTSPHLKDFRERIKLNGEMIPKEFVIEFVEKTKLISSEISPSFFELTFVMALEYFAEQSVDIAIIETGLGGRLDSTNIIIPEISVITNIGYDHMDILGNTLEKIAFEKAGIIKRDVPVIIGETNSVTKPIFETRARELNAPIYFAEEKYKVLFSQSHNDSLEIDLLDNSCMKKNKYFLDLSALYQIKNLVTVVATIDQLSNSFHLNEVSTTAALGQVKSLTKLHGRWEIINRQPLVVLDVAHNVDGIQQLLHQIDNSSHKNLHIVFGMVKDKEIEGVLEILPKNASYYFTKAQISRALPELELLEKARQFHLKGFPFTEVNKALSAAINNASPEDMIIVCGSVFVVGEVNLL